ncbi:MAG TPA: hypothetical protein VG917_06155 [Patescibacteria group bacterium]|nr:hypothetical protein [Patescibacteria group bacterium]
MAKDSPIYQKLRDKWTAKHKELQKSLWEKHGNVIDDFVTGTRNFAIGSVSALMLLSSPVLNNALPASTAITVQEEHLPVSKSVFLINDLSTILPDEVRPLTADEESSVSAVLTRDFGVPITAELDGKRLNRSYGYIGAEQHLARYPGDTMETHFNTPNGPTPPEEIRKAYSSGMAPGLGGWGYFAPSAAEMTQVESDREKYYIAVQSFLAPGFAENTGDYIKFFKFRKMIVVNPQNGKAIVADIGDAGPAEWTGKSLGGSPEVMNYLERVDGKARGAVLYYFIDDPEDKIPLGPIEMK